MFEGVATGAADGFARRADRPAATLLHLGCGLGNGLANLHNARKARVPMINIIGDHATYHTKYDAQLQSDIETVARNVSTWVRTCPDTKQLAADGGRSSLGGQRTAGADIHADPAGRCLVGVMAPSRLMHPLHQRPVRHHKPTSRQVAEVLNSGKKTALLVGGRVLREEGLRAASQIAQKTGAKLLCEVFPTRLQRGAGLPSVERIAYLAELASVQLSGFEHLILIDAKAPVSFFAYPNKKSYLVPENCEVHSLVDLNQNALASLEALVGAVDATQVEPKLQQAERPPAAQG